MRHSHSFVRLRTGGEHAPLQVDDEHLAVADLAGARRLHDRVDYAVDLVVLGHDLQLDLRPEVHLVFSPPVDLGMATLAPERQAKLLTAPDVEEIVSLAGRPAVG